MRIRLGVPRSRNQWLLAVAGAAVTVGCIVPLARGVSSLSWPKVDGVITQSGYMPGHRAMGVAVAYRYTAGGQTHTGNRYRFQFVLTARKMRGRDVQSAIGRYGPGEPVRVAVNPGDPDDSVLEPGPDFETLIPFGLGLAMLTLGLGRVTEERPARAARSKARYGLAKVLAGMGLGLVALGGWYLYQGVRSVEWPSVEGRILYSHARGGRHPETLLWYEYTVEGRRYVASNYRNGGNVTPFLGAAEAAAERYAAGRVVAVYYDPGDPERALLERGVWWGNFVAPGLGVLLVGAGWIAKRYAEIMAVQRGRS